MVGFGRRQLNLLPTTTLGDNARVIRPAIVVNPVGLELCTHHLSNPTHLLARLDRMGKIGSLMNIRTTIGRKIREYPFKRF